jgi:hypothetical protein
VRNEKPSLKTAQRRLFCACERVRSKPMRPLADLGNLGLWTCCEFAADNTADGTNDVLMRSRLSPRSHLAFIGDENAR